MGSINREWHLAKKMPKKPSEDVRLKWHVEHAKHCTCREMTEKIKEEAKKMGLL